MKVKNQRYYPAVEGDDIRSIRFRPELTSIRAPMALLVIAAHNDQSWRRGFWIGLNTWMAISGFVITLSLLTEYDRVGKISIKNFYIRRALRLLPALYVASIAVLLFGWITHQGDYLLQYVYSTLAAIFYYEDIFVVATYGHGFAVFAQLWTLSLEEQFYIIWVIFLVFFLKKYDKEALLKFSIGTVIFIWIYRIIIFEITHSPQRIYYSFDTRLDAIMIGCIVALWASTGRLSTRIPDWYRNWAPYIAWIGFIGLAISMSFVTIMTVFSSTLGIPMADIFTLMIMPYMVLTPDSKRARVLSHQPLIHLGNLTYTMYVWGWIVVLQVNTTNTHMSPWPLFGLRLLVIFVLSEITYWLFEVPLRKLRKIRFTVKEMRGLTTLAP